MVLRTHTRGAAAAVRTCDAASAAEAEGASHTAVRMAPGQARTHHAAVANPSAPRAGAHGMRCSHTRAQVLAQRAVAVRC